MVRKPPKDLNFSESSQFHGFWKVPWPFVEIVTAVNGPGPGGIILIKGVCQGMIFQEKRHA